MTGREITEEERRALKVLRPDWAPTSEEAWTPSPFHVDGLHPSTENQILEGLAEAQTSTGPSPIGLVIRGEGGSGKTHLLGWVREQVHRDGGYFFLVDFSGGSEFWSRVLLSLREGLTRRLEGRPTQLTTVMGRLADLARVDGPVRSAVAGQAPLSRTHLDGLLAGLNRCHPQVAVECQDTIRALALFASTDFAEQTVGLDHLAGDGSLTDAGDRTRWGLRRPPKDPQSTVEDLSRILALTGWSVIALDQLDSLISTATASTITATEAEAPREAGVPATTAGDVALEEMAGGLMALRQRTLRSFCLVACLTSTWGQVRERAVATVQDRFRVTVSLGTIADSAVARAMLAKRFAVDFATVDFVPPHPTWPVAASAFESAVGFTPRGLLQRLDAHIDACLLAGTVLELTDFAVTSGRPPRPEPDPPTPRMEELDARFAQLRRDADVSAALDWQQEDALMPALLQAGFRAWIRELGPAGKAFSCDPPPAGKPDLHSRLRQVVDLDTEQQRHWAIRAISAPDARAALARLRAAIAAAGIGPGRLDRRLIVLRNLEWSGGDKTRQARAALDDAGGASLHVTNNDLANFAALRTMLADGHPDLDGWLRLRRPAGSTELLAAVLAGAEPETAVPDPAVPDPAAPAVAALGTAVPGPRAPTPVRLPQPSAQDRDDAITLGVNRRTQAPIRVRLESLRKHTAIFAGAGSGKTVLIRRLVEEAALQGVSSIVLDPNNDLARLGDPWPQAPAGWANDDDARAEQYMAEVDVDIWTPGLSGGRPLSFQPLPDLRPVQDDQDEFDDAIEAAVAALVPRAKVEGRRSRAGHGQAILREALRYLTSHGGFGLDAFLELLRDLPDEASSLDDANKLAREMAKDLQAAMVNDTAFAGNADPVDPGVLLTPGEGRRARVSVISFIGLRSEEQQQGFVNQLQTNLFSWVKRHPAQDRPLGGLLVMDEAQTLAPSRVETVSSQSTRMLTAMARKYGLGLVFATQGPRDIHNSVIGNCTTQFFGRLNSSTHIDVAKEMAAAKGSRVDRIGKLERGQFYLTGENITFVEMQSPLCLSYHPSSPLTPDEVRQRARRRPV